MAKIDEILSLMTERGASDLHLASGSAPYLRIHGEMVKLNYKPVSPEVCKGLILEILSDYQRETFLEEWDLDCSYAIKGVGRFRVNAFNQKNGCGAVFRRIPEEIQTLEELGLPEVLSEQLNLSEGLILVTGPTGSGKSTTLAALIHAINVKERAHIITIEDPIEFVHHNQLSLINQREVSSHTKSFHGALRAALREDPDVILVGEMRDLETISLALTAAETGHLVFATLHTNSATKTVDRIIDVFPEGQQSQIRVMLSESLRAVIAQTLVRKSEGEGRVPVVEVLINTPAVANLIREAKTFQLHSSMQTGQVHGMVTFESAINNLVRKGLVSRQDGQAFLTRRGVIGKNANGFHRA
jgi:twitching motility protein PilT